MAYNVVQHKSVHHGQQLTAVGYPLTIGYYLTNVGVPPTAVGRPSNLPDGEGDRFLCLGAISERVWGGRVLRTLSEAWKVLNPKNTVMWLWILVPKPMQEGPRYPPVCIVSHRTHGP